MVQKTDKWDYCLKGSKWHARSHITRDFAAHLCACFPTKAYTETQVKSKIRNLEDRSRGFHAEVESLKKNKDPSLIVENKGTPRCGQLSFALVTPPASLSFVDIYRESFGRRPIMTLLPTSCFQFGYSTKNSYGCPYACFRQASLFLTTVDSLSGSPNKLSKRTCRWNAGCRVNQPAVLFMMTQRRRLLSSPPLDQPSRTMARPSDPNLVRGGLLPTCLMCRMAIAPAVDVRD